MNREESLSKHSKNYLPCFIDSCPRHKLCLHWLTGQHTTDTNPNITIVNPLNPEVKANKCPFYREAVLVDYARGMMHFYDDMPSRFERYIKARLIHLFTRKRYYEYRNGTRLISPDVQQQIAAVCRENGWEGDLHYDAWEEDFLW